MKKYIKSYLLGVLTVVLIIGLIAPAAAISGKMTIEVNPINIQVDGKVFQPKDVTGKEVPVFEYNGTTYAPLRALAEAYGLVVGYDQSQNLATVSKPGSETTTPTSQPTDSVSKPFGRVEINMDNWSEYLEYSGEVIEWKKDAFGEVSECAIEHRLQIKPQYKSKLVSFDDLKTLKDTKAWDEIIENAYAQSVHIDAKHSVVYTNVEYGIDFDNTEILSINPYGEPMSYTQTYVVHEGYYKSSGKPIDTDAYPTVICGSYMVKDDVNENGLYYGASSFDYTLLNIKGFMYLYGAGTQVGKDTPAEPDTEKDAEKNPTGITLTIGDKFPVSKSDSSTYRSSPNATYQITSLDYSIDGSSIHFTIAGKKTFDYEGSSYRRKLVLGWELRDSDNAVVKTGEIFGPTLSKGETFKDCETTITNVKPGEYTLWLVNHYY